MATQVSRVSYYYYVILLLSLSGYIHPPTYTHGPAPTVHDTTSAIRSFLKGLAMRNLSFEGLFHNEIQSFSTSIYRKEERNSEATCGTIRVGNDPANRGLYCWDARIRSLPQMTISIQWFTQNPAQLESCLISVAMVWFV